MILIRIGLMNILKNLRRDSLTLLMISFGMCALFIYSGSNADMFRQFKGLVIKKQYGYFQLHAAGYIENEKSRPFDFLIRHSEVVAGKLQRLEAVRSGKPSTHDSSYVRVRSVRSSRLSRSAKHCHLRDSADGERRGSRN